MDGVAAGGKTGLPPPVVLLFPALLGALLALVALLALPLVCALEVERVCLGIYSKR